MLHPFLKSAPYIRMDLNCNLTENQKPEFKPTTKILQDKLHQEKCKQSKGTKVCASIRMELDCEKFSRTFCKLFTRQNMQKKYAKLNKCKTFQ